MTGLTERERIVLAFIESHLEQRGYPPTVREIGNQLGAASSSTPQHFLRQLERKGLLRRDPRRPRALQLIRGGRA